MSEINLKSYVKSRADMDVTDMDGELVMMDLDKGRYFAMNEQASAIWRELETGQEVEVIVNRLSEEYEVNEKTCKEEVLGFIRMLDDAKLIEQL